MPTSPYGPIPYSTGTGSIYGPTGGFATQLPGLPPMATAAGDPVMSPPTQFDPTAPPPPGTMGGPFGSPNQPAFQGDAADFLKALYTSRPNFLRQQGDLLSTLGGPLRQAALNASPELGQVAGYFQNLFNDPFGGARETFEDSIRGAQAARGFTGGGSGVVGEEARYLTNFAERRRQEAIPQLMQFGQQLLSIGGLQSPPDIGLGVLGGLAFQNRNLNETIEAGERQSNLAQQMYNQALGGGSPAGGGGSPYGGGGSTNVIVGGGGAGQGTDDFFARQQAETEALLATRRAYAQGLLGNVDPFGPGGGGVM